MKKEYDLHLDWNGDRPGKIFAGIARDTFFRLNPHWIIDSFSAEKDGYVARIVDHETEEQATLHGTIVFDPAGLPCLAASEGVWQRISFSARSGRLHADVEYSGEPSEEEERRVVLWLRSIKEYLRLYSKTTLNTRLFRFVMNRIILKMTPSQRKISLMLIRITILELLAILLILVGWFGFVR